MTTAVVNHYNVQPVFDVYASVQGRDLGGVAADLDQVIEKIAGPVDPKTGIRTKLPKGSNLILRGQVESMKSSFRGWRSDSSSRSCWFTC